jgi:hypothetical protein
LSNQRRIGRRILRCIRRIIEHLGRVLDAHEPADLFENALRSEHEILVVDLDGSIVRQVEDQRVPAALGLDPELGALVDVSRPPLLNDRAGDVSRSP